MKTINEIMQALTGPSVLDDLKDLVRTHEDTFPHEEATFQEAVSFLKSVIPEAVVDEYVKAHETEVINNILYAAYEGYRANLQNFYSPYATRFPSMDFTQYIRDHLIGKFPPAIAAGRICDAFAGSLPEGCAEAEEVVTSYFSLLDVYGPKLAHYVGYMLSNELLSWVVPGYRPDYSQTSLYRIELEKYIGFVPA